MPPRRIRCSACGRAVLPDEIAQDAKNAERHDKICTVCAADGNSRPQSSAPAAPAAPAPPLPTHPTVDTTPPAAPQHLQPKPENVLHSPGSASSSPSGSPKQRFGGDGILHSTDPVMLALSEHKLCRECNKMKPATEYSRSQWQKAEFNRRRVCRKCQREVGAIVAHPDLVARTQRCSWCHGAGHGHAIGSLPPAQCRNCSGTGRSVCCGGCGGTGIIAGRCCVSCGGHGDVTPDSDTPGFGNTPRYTVPADVAPLDASALAGSARSASASGAASSGGKAHVASAKTSSTSLMSLETERSVVSRCAANWYSNSVPAASLRFPADLDIGHPTLDAAAVKPLRFIVARVGGSSTLFWHDGTGEAPRRDSQKVVIYQGQRFDATAFRVLYAKGAERFEYQLPKVEPTYTIEWVRASETQQDNDNAVIGVNETTKLWRGKQLVSEFVKHSHLDETRCEEGFVTGNAKAAAGFKSEIAQLLQCEIGGIGQPASWGTQIPKMMESKKHWLRRAITEYSWSGDE